MAFKIDVKQCDAFAIFKHTTGKCRLCNTEKYLVMFKPEDATINKGTEFYSTCRHREKNLLKKVKVND